MEYEVLNEMVCYLATVVLRLRGFSNVVDECQGRDAVIKSKALYSEWKSAEKRAGNRLAVDNHKRDARIDGPRLEEKGSFLNFGLETYVQSKRL